MMWTKTVVDGCLRMVRRWVLNTRIQPFAKVIDSCFEEVLLLQLMLFCSIRYLYVVYLHVLLCFFVLLKCSLVIKKACVVSVHLSAARAAWQEMFPVISISIQASTQILLSHMNAKIKYEKTLTHRRQDLKEKTELTFGCWPNKRGRSFYGQMEPKLNLFMIDGKQYVWLKTLQCMVKQLATCCGDVFVRKK